MKKLVLIISCLCFLVPGSFGQYKPYAKQVVEKLCSAQLHGRGYVKKGDKKAAKYLGNEFKTIGIVPVFEDTYFQEFEMSVNTFPGACRLRLNEEIDLSPGEHFIVEPSSPAISGTFKVLKLSSQEDWKEAIGKVRESVFLHINKNEIEEYGKILSAVSTTKHQNLSGVIVTGYEKLTWSTATYQSETPIILLQACATVPSRINTLETKISTRFMDSYESKNVIGMVAGDNEDSIIVVSAHYDHLGRMGKRTLFPGANDNASGIAQLLALAKYFSENKPKYTIVFVAFGGEEAGLLGSQFFVKNPLFPLAKIKFVLNLDIAGTGDEGIQVVNSTIFKEEFGIMEAINSKEEYVPHIKMRGEACNSDHCSFHMRGVKSFFIYTLGGIQAYHDIYDIPETLPLTAFQGCFDLYRQFLEAL